MRRKVRTKKPNRHKTKLGLPDLEHVKSAVLVSLRSPESQRSYRAPSKISSPGIARNLGFRSTKQWSAATGFISKTSCLHLGPSM
jgi:hypothetical protein